jgi:predicted O-methyltransferase YrrM
MELERLPKRFLKKTLRGARVWVRDTPGILLTSAALRWLRWVRRVKLHRMPRTLALIERLGVFPLNDHFYEPMVRRGELDRTWPRSRSIPGIKIDLEEQWKLLDGFDYRDELQKFTERPSDPNAFYYDNSYFGPGDADFYYSIIRKNKPKRIIEIGSGYSTRLACAAARANEAEVPGQGARITCIEPFSNDAMLSALDIDLIRTPVEEVDLDLFAKLEPGDILFIDSSHMLRPEGDVLYEIQQILPRVAPGVWVHVHDIFTPRDYPPHWLIDRMSFWNEQYLLEAFLAFNPDFRVAAALNYLCSVDRQRVRSRLPLMDLRPDAEMASFWIVRIAAA